jgi:PIN domain nuclease of toxin-antitoxin system
VIVLDTHAWIWFASESRKLSRAAASAIKRADRIGVHPISCWEVAMLVERDRLRLSMDTREWIDVALARPRVELLPFTSAASVRAAQFGAAFPGDPADRFIVAATLESRATLVSRDERIASWKGIKVIW